MSLRQPTSTICPSNRVPMALELTPLEPPAPKPAPPRPVLNKSEAHLRPYIIESYPLFPTASQTLFHPINNSPLSSAYLSIKPAVTHLCNKQTFQSHLES